MLVPVCRLQQKCVDDLELPRVRVLGTALTRPLRPSAALARLLYSTIGRECGWQSRLAWPEHDWQRVLTRPGTELWLSWCDERVTGFAEIAGGEGDDHAATRIRCLGLFPEFRGRGLGAKLLSDVTGRAWTLHRRSSHLPPVQRVVLDTTGWDDHRALPNYLARGFAVTEHLMEDRPAAVIPPRRGPEPVRH